MINNENEQLSADIAEFNDKITQDISIYLHSTVETYGPMTEERLLYSTIKQMSKIRKSMIKLIFLKLNYYG